VETVYLTIESDTSQYRCDLTWTPYVGFDGGVKQYEVYRGIDDVFDPFPLQTLSPNTFQYSDNLESVSGKKTLCYKIVAVENINQYLKSERANSNLGCANFSSTLFIPNAFQPTGENKLFRPIYSYQDYSNYEMLIFNRWAQLVHQSDQSGMGWDGLILSKGELAQPGVYIYRIRFSDEFGNEILREGWLTLLR
jgi:gliding motility-associated-like protein